MKYYYKVYNINILCISHSGYSRGRPLDLTFKLKTSSQEQFIEIGNRKKERRIVRKDRKKIPIQPINRVKKIMLIIDKIHIINYVHMRSKYPLYYYEIQYIMLIIIYYKHLCSLCFQILIKEFYKFFFFYFFKCTFIPYVKVLKYKIQNVL